SSDLSHNVFMALDADAAGQKATLKGLNALREGAEEGEGGHLVTTAQGAVRLESDVSLRIIKMPEGRDPDEVIKADPELWRQLVIDAVPVMEFYIGTYTVGLDLADPQGQRAALDKLLPLLAELDGAQQRVYIARIEQVIGIKAELILDLLRGEARGLGVGGRKLETKPRRPNPSAQRPAPSAQRPDIAPRTPHRVEDNLLALALRHSTVVPAAVEALLEQGLLPFPSVRDLMGGGLEDLLESPANQQIWVAFSALPIESRPIDEAGLAEWANGLEETLGERMLSLLAIAQPDPQAFRHRREAEDCARSLRVGQAAGWGERLKHQAEDCADPDEQLRLIALWRDVSYYKESLRQPRRSSTFPDLRDSLGKT
ncbi:MAG: DNA primase, partial [Oscillochloris sp.]|nr:DNA primase [Oscillochloris sp.]